MGSKGSVGFKRAAPDPEGSLNKKPDRFQSARGSKRCRSIRSCSFPNEDRVAAVSCAQLFKRLARRILERVSYGCEFKNYARRVRMADSLGRAVEMNAAECTMAKTTKKTTEDTEAAADCGHQEGEVRTSRYGREKTSSNEAGEESGRGWCA
mgnify:CR=1 FL=1